MYYELDNDEPIREAVTDNYYPYINTGQIKPIKAHLSRFVIFVPFNYFRFFFLYLWVL